MKPGRNDPCHCGSGRKYKRCHLDVDERKERTAAELGRAVLVDLPTVHMAAVAARPGFTEQAISTADALNAGFRAEIGAGLEGQEAAKALARYLEAVEGAMAEIAREHSRGYWMHLTRRLPARPLGSATDWTVRLYRRVLTLAVIKHGQRTVRDDEFTTVGTKIGRAQVPADLTPEAIVDVFALEYLAYEYTTASQAYRRVGKGARLQVVGDDFHAVADNELEDLIQDVDRRVLGHGELTGIYGAAADRDFPMERSENDDTPIAILATVPNTDGIPPEKAMMSKGLNVPGPTNFVAVPLVIDGYRETLATLSTDVEDALGVPPEVLLGVVWGLSIYLLRGIQESPPVEVQLLKTGYLLREKGADWDATATEVSWRVAAWFEYFGLGRPDQVEARSLADAGLAALTYHEEAISSISLWDRLPFNFIIDAGTFLLIDYSVLPEMIATVFRQVGLLDGDSGNIKAKNFEAAVVARARAEGFEPWKEGVELVHRDGTKREIDAGFVAGDTLWAVECKAYAQNPKIDRGDWAALQSRQTQLVKYLDQAQTLAEFIDSERYGRNYDVPPKVKRIEHVLCTPGVEFIWSREPDLWLTDQISRICTPDELMLLLTEAAGS